MLTAKMRKKIPTGKQAGGPISPKIPRPVEEYKRTPTTDPGAAARRFPLPNPLGPGKIKQLRRGGPMKAKKGGLRAYKQGGRVDNPFTSSSRTEHAIPEYE